MLQVNKYYLLSKVEWQEAKFGYSPNAIAFVKLTKAIDDQGEQLIKAIESHKRQLYQTNIIDKKMILILMIVKRNIYEVYNKIFFKKR